MAVLSGLDEKILALKPEDVLKSYRGKTGCACGCNGRYAYVDAEAGTKERGYEVGADEVSLNKVTNDLRTVQQNVARVTAYDFGGTWCYDFEADGRAVRVYVR